MPRASKKKSRTEKFVETAIDKATNRGSKKGKGQGKKRSRGPQYWANKVLVQKLKTKYYKLKYRGV